MRPLNGSRVYAIGQKGGVEYRQWVPSPQVFADYGYSWSAVQLIQASELARYRRVSLLRQRGDPKVYYLTESGLKRHIPNQTAFTSYGNRWEDIVEVSAAELSAIPDSILIRAVGATRVYKLEEGRKRWIRTPDVFRQQGFDWARIAPVNQMELDSYPVGPDLE